MTVDQSIYNSIFATEFVVVCLIVGCKYFTNKFKGAIEKRKEWSLDDNIHQDVLHANDPEENEYAYSHYETIKENEMIEMSYPSYPTTSEKWSDLSYLKQETDDKNNTEIVVEIETNIFIKTVKQAMSPYLCQLILQNSLEMGTYQMKIKKQAHIKTNIFL